MFLDGFLARNSIYAERAICYRLSVCPSVRHTDGSVKNGWSYIGSCNFHYK